MIKSENKPFKLATKLTRLGRNPAEQHGFVNTPIYRGSTVIFKTFDDIENDRAEFTYGTHGTPLIRNLANAWTELNGGAGTVMVPSGLAAIAIALQAVTRAGGHLLMPDSVYGPTRGFCNRVLARFGVETTYYDPLAGSDIEKQMRPETTCIFLESPGSQTFEVQDVPAITAVAKKYGAKTVIDNTWATPLFFRPHDYGCDLSVEAGTKYLSGHSDLLIGLISANEATWPALHETYTDFAPLPGPEDCFLALRGLRTMHLRLQEAEKRGLEIAAWLQKRPEITRVLHPAFPDCPGHEIWKRDFSGATGVFSVVLAPEYSREDLARMLDGFAIFGMGYSWGGFESLITHFNAAPVRTVTEWKPGGLTFRLQIGLEDMDDLKEDLDKGFARLRNRP